MNFKEKLSLVSRSAVALGVIETLKAIARYVLRPKGSTNFDKRFSTETATQVNKSGLGISDAYAFRHATFYRTVPPQFIRYLIRNLGINYCEYEFVDIGCGKGLVLLIASNYPFRSITGIEISPSLYAVAKRNIAIYRSNAQKCSNIEIHNQDARRFEPVISNTVFYLFEPFDMELLIEIMTKISSALNRQGKSVYVVFIWSHFAPMLAVLKGLGFQILRHHEMPLSPALEYTVATLRS